MDRYTKQDALVAFNLLCASTGNRRATAWNDVGGWQLDYNSVYGGYVVHEVSNESGGVSEPFGSRRRPAREFCLAVNFAIRAIEQLNNSREDFQEHEARSIRAQADAG